METTAPVRLLCVADEEAAALTPERIRRLAPDLIIGCGDLSFRYLEYVSSVLDAPLVFVPGNHDPRRGHARLHRSGLWTQDGLPADPPRPLGGTNLDGRLVDVGGLTLAGLGGCVRYRPGPHQYSQAQYRRRAALLRWRARLTRRSPDILVTHAPPRGLGDEEDPPHHGIEALHDLVPRLGPRLLLHGHIHPHGQPRPDRVLGNTLVCNVVPWRLLTLPVRVDGTEPARTVTRDA